MTYDPLNPTAPGAYADESGQQCSVQPPTGEEQQEDAVKHVVFASSLVGFTLAYVGAAAGAYFLCARRRQSGIDCADSSALKWALFVTFMVCTGVSTALSIQCCQDNDVAR